MCPNVTLTAEEQAALKTIVQGDWMTQPVLPPAVKERLIKLGLVRQTLGGSLKATDEGVVADPETLAAILSVRRGRLVQAAALRDEQKRKKLNP